MIQPRSILVVRGGAIGDFVLTLPVFASLRQAFPQASMHILGRPAIAQLAVAGGLADVVKDLDCASLVGLFIPGGRLDRTWLEYFAPFDLVVSFIHDPHGTFRNHIQHLTAASYLQGIYRPLESQKLHATEAFLGSLKALSIPLCPPLPQLHLKSDTPPFSRPVIALHPGSGSKSKNWPLPQWGELIQALLAHTEFDLLLIGGESDANECARLLSDCPSGRVQTALNFPLVSLADSLQGCRFYIGHDTGITHLAAALGVPSLALWGPSLGQIWAPPQPHVTLLEDPRGLSHLQSSTVLRAVLDALARPRSIAHLS